PPTSCSTLGRTERMRVPSPAASTIARQERSLIKFHPRGTEPAHVLEGGSRFPDKAMRPLIKFRARTDCAATGPVGAIPTGKSVSNAAGTTVMRIGFCEHF